MSGREWLVSAQRDIVITNQKHGQQKLRGMPRLYTPKAVREAEKWIQDQRQATEDARQRVKELEQKLKAAEDEDVANAARSIREGAAERELAAPGIRELLGEAKVKLQAHEQVFTEVWAPMFEAIRESYVGWRRDLMAALPEAETEAREAFEDFVKVWKEARKVRDGVVYLDRFMVEDLEYLDAFNAILPGYFERPLRSVLEYKAEDHHKDRSNMAGPLGMTSTQDLAIGITHRLAHQPSYLDDWDPERGFIGEAEPSGEVIQ